MNEFDVVRGIGADTPDPDAAATGAARARLLAAIRAEAATGGAAVTDIAVGLGARRMARTPRRRWLLPGGAAVAAVLATALAVPLLLHDPAPVTQERDSGTGVTGDVLATAEPAAVKVLATAAAAARTLEPPFGPGKHWYVRERGAKVYTNLDQAGSPRSFFYRTPYEHETWWALDGSLRVRENNGRPRFLTPAERAAWVAAGRPKLNVPNRTTRTENPGTSDRSDGWLPLTYEQIIDLPTDPARLTDHLSERLYAGQPNGSCPIPPGLDVAAVRCPHRPVTDGDRFRAIVFLTTHYPLPAELRSALYQALTRLDGIKLIGEVADSAGRRGVGITRPDEEADKDQPVRERGVLIFDPATGHLLGSQYVLAAEVRGWRLTPGTVMQETAFLETSVVDTPTTRPKADR